MKAFRRLVACLLVPALAAAAPGPGEPAGDPSGLRREAVARYREGRYEEAIGLFRRLAETAPQDGDVARDLMWALWRAEKYDEASQAARRLQEIHPKDADAARVLAEAPVRMSQKDFNHRRESAVALYRKGRYDEAADLYRDLAALHPEDQKLAKDLMWSLWQAGRKEEAAEAAARVAAVDPNDREVWNLRGDALLAIDRPQEAAAAYEASLEVSPRQPRIMMALARIYEKGRDEARAEDALERIRSLNPGNRQVYAPLARIQFNAGRYSQAAENWRRAAEFFPDRRDYALNEARSLYYAGRLAAAMDRMKALSRAGVREAADFLIDDAWAAKDWGAAEALLEQHKGDPIPQNEGRWMKLIVLTHDQGKPARHRALLEQFLTANPRNDRALMMKARALEASGAKRGAAAIYRRILGWNPRHEAALMKLADLRARAGDPRGAIALLEDLRQQDPADPSLLLLRERYLLEVDREAARESLLEWLKNNEEPALPVLLYHGLAASSRDPMLAHPVHMAAATFESHMRALRDAGYSPVTAGQVNDWIHGNGRLPERPVLITFDDGRADSFRLADPVLKKYGLKATMYSCLVNLEGHRPTYAPWAAQEAYARTGRWEIESHGDLAHTRIPSGRGQSGLFLLNRAWDPQTEKMESVDAWKKRLQKDHEGSKTKIREKMGVEPVSFAFPEGDYGQQSVPNAPDAAEVNLDLVRRSYAIAFHQDEFGVNVRSRDPMLLARLEPDPAWSGDELVEYLRAADPFTRVYRSLLKQALWQGHTHEAARWLAELRRRGTAEAIVSAEEGRIRFNTGDTAGGYEMSRRALTKSRDPETAGIVSSMQERRGAGWTPSYRWQRDEEERESGTFEQSLQVPLKNGQRWTLEHRAATFRDKTADERVTDAGVGLRWRVPLGFFHAITVAGMGHSISEAPDGHELSIHAASKWTDTFATEAEAARSLYDTALALRAGIRQDHAGLLLRWTPGDGWRFTARGRRAELSDDNSRDTWQADLSRALDDRARWRLLGRYTHDDMRRVSPSYYSPQRLNEGLGGLEYGASGRGGRVYLRYLAGSGRERAGDPVFVQEVEAEARLALSERTSLAPLAVFSRSPRYWRNTWGLALQHWFGG